MAFAAFRSSSFASVFICVDPWLFAV